MKCPYCLHEELKVVDKRDSDTDIRRRRECLKCGKRFTTHERVESMEIIIVKKDGKRERYDRDKLRKSVLMPCEKREITAAQIEDTVDKIEKELRNFDSTEVPSKKLGSLVMKHLKKLDKVSYIRFAAVYKDFTDIEEFQEELNKLLRK